MKMFRFRKRLSFVRNVEKNIRDISLIVNVRNFKQNIKISDETLKTSEKTS